MKREESITDSKQRCVTRWRKTKQAIAEKTIGAIRIRGAKHSAGWKRT
jgi:hypothetical protein